MYEGVDWPYDDTRELREMWRMYLPPAATWIMIAGSKIRELCFMDQLPEDDNKHSVQSQWGGRTYCSGRWTFRKRRFLGACMGYGDRHPMSGVYKDSS